VVEEDQLQNGVLVSKRLFLVTHVHEALGLCGLEGMCQGVQCTAGV